MVDTTQTATNKHLFDQSQIMSEIPARALGRVVERSDDSKKSIPVNFNKSPDDAGATRSCKYLNSIDEDSDRTVGGLEINGNWGTIKEYSNEFAAVEQLFSLHQVMDIKPVQGGQATVYCYSDKNNRHRYAIKVIKEDNSKPEDLKLNRKDICGLIAGENQYIVPIYAMVLECINNNSYLAIRSKKDIPADMAPQFRAKIIISKYFDGSDLTDVINGETTKVKFNIGPKLAIHVAKQLVQVVLYLHKHHIFFQDLKPDNIMINQAGEIQLVDFGLAMKTPSSRRYSIAGSLSYLSPEIVELFGVPRDKSKGYTCKTDLWSLGITLIALTLGEDLLNLCRSYQGANGFHIPLFASYQLSMEICTPWFSRLEDKEKRKLLLQELEQVIKTPVHSEIEKDLIVNIIIGLTREKPDERMPLEEAHEKLNESLPESAGNEAEVFQGLCI